MFLSGLGAVTAGKGVMRNTASSEGLAAARKAAIGAKYFMAFSEPAVCATVFAAAGIADEPAAGGRSKRTSAAPAESLAFALEAAGAADAPKVVAGRSSGWAGAKSTW